MLTVEQCRGARGLLGWTQQDLAEYSGLSKTAINNFEKGHSDIKAESLNAIFMAFESADIEFLGSEGLRKRTDYAQILRAPAAFEDIMSDMGDAVKTSKKDILIRNLDTNFIRHLTPQRLLDHAELLKTHDVSQRILYPEGVKGPLIQGGLQRYVPGETSCGAMTVFIYGAKVAFGLWGNTQFVIVNSAEAHEAERERFEKIWAVARAMPESGQFATRESRRRG